MISSELVPAAPGPVQPRNPGRAAAGAPPERPFEDFVEDAPKPASEAGEAAATEDAETSVEVVDLTAVRDVAVEIVAKAADLLALDDVADPGVEPADLLALLDVAATVEAATPPAPAAVAVPTSPAPAATAVPTPLSVAAVPPPAASADEAEPAVPVAAAPASPPAAPVAAPLPASRPAAASPAIAGAEPEIVEEPPADTGGEVEPERALRHPAVTVGAPAVGWADLRPAAAAPPPAPFELALQPASAQSWRLSALAADAMQPAHEPARAPAPRDVAGQITIAIAQATQPQVEIRLDPPELGRVQIRLNPTEHGLQAVVLADRPETQDFLRRHAETLRSDLGEAGYASVVLDFAAGGDAPSREAPEGEWRLMAALEQTAAPTAVREAPRRVTAAGLDIRL